MSDAVSASESSTDSASAKRQNTKRPLLQPQHVVCSPSYSPESAIATHDGRARRAPALLRSCRSVVDASGATRAHSGCLTYAPVDADEGVSAEGPSFISISTMRCDDTRCEALPPLGGGAGS